MSESVGHCQRMSENDREIIVKMENTKPKKNKDKTKKDAKTRMSENFGSVRECRRMSENTRKWHRNHSNDQCIQIIEFLCAQCTPCKASVFVTFWSPSGIEPKTLVQWASHSTNVLCKAA